MSKGKCIPLTFSKKSKQEEVSLNQSLFLSNSVDVIENQSRKYDFKLRANDVKSKERNVNNIKSLHLKTPLLTNNVNNKSISDSKRNSIKRKSSDCGTSFDGVGGFVKSRKMAKMELVGDIQQLINDQIRMREGAMKLMSACSTLNQALETSKNLLTINARVLGLMSALQRKKKEHVLEEYNRRNSWAINEPGISPCNGRLAISDIRVPLMWKDNVHFTGKTGDQLFYAFALLRCGDQVRDTQLYEITSVDTDMYFDTTIIFEELNPSFKIEFELYYTVITNNESMSIRAPMRGHMNLRAPKKSVQFKAPKFCLAGHATLNVDDIKAGIVSKDLVMGGTGASGVAVLGDINEFPAHPLELWGQICCQMSAQPKCMLDKQIIGECHIQADDEWSARYCEVYQCKIFSWIDKSNKSDVQTYSLKPNNKVMERENVLEIVNSENKEEYSMKFSNADEANKWKKAISISISSLRLWKYACEQFMHIEETKLHRLSIPSYASFYDQIDISKCNGNSPTLKNDISVESNGTHSPKDKEEVKQNNEEVFTTNTPEKDVDDKGLDQITDDKVESNKSIDNEQSNTEKKKHCQDAALHSNQEPSSIPNNSELNKDIQEESKVEEKKDSSVIESETKETSKPHDNNELKNTSQETQKKPEEETSDKNYDSSLHDETSTIKQDSNLDTEQIVECEENKNTNDTCEIVTDESLKTIEKIIASVTIQKNSHDVQLEEKTGQTKLTDANNDSSIDENTIPEIPNEDSSAASPDSSITDPNPTESESIENESKDNSTSASNINETSSANESVGTPVIDPSEEPQTSKVSESEEKLSENAPGNVMETSVNDEIESNTKETQETT